MKSRRLLSVKNKKNIINLSSAEDWHSGSVVELLLCDWEVVGLIPGGVIPKTLKMVLAAFSLGTQH